jgi:hypothetical protein
MTEDAPLLLVRISVSYYPTTLDPDLMAFSAEEVAIVTGDWMDASGAPRIERADSIPHGFFSVGAIECLFDPEGVLVAIAMAALDRCRTVAGEDWNGDSYPLGRIRRRGGEQLRDVPGWDLTRPVFAALAGLGAQLGQRSATRLVVTRQPGFEMVRLGNRCQLEDCDAVVQGEALVLLGGSAGGAATAARDPRLDLVDPGADPVLDLALTGVPVAEPSFDPRLGMRIEGAWFSTEPVVERGLCCSC